MFRVKIVLVKVKIRLARKSDIKVYTELLQRTYQDTYVDEDLGFTKELFSKEIFNTDDTQKYLRGNLEISDKQKTWLAFVGTKLIGSVTIADKGEEFGMRGFYVRTEDQGKGVGKKLWKLARGFAKGKDILLDIYTHNTKAIEIYKQWGFLIDAKKKEFYRRWPEWPEGIKTESVYMRYKQVEK